MDKDQLAQVFSRQKSDSEIFHASGYEEAVEVMKSFLSMVDGAR